MRFEFLGTGTSAGVPVLGCDCAVCTSDDPRDQRLRTSALLRFTDPKGQPRAITLDCGPDFRQQALRAKLERLDAVVFTHNHVDHTFGLDETRRYNAIQQGPIDIYADGHTLDHLKRVYRHIFDRAHNINDSFVATLIAHQIEPDEPFDLFGLRFTPIPLLHGRLPILGYRIESVDGRVADPAGVLPLAYCTDVSAIPTESWGLFMGVRTLVLDCLRHRRHPTHLTVGQAISITQRIAPDRAYFIHMTHDLPHAETDAELPETMHLAYDGLVLGAED